MPSIISTTFTTESAVLGLADVRRQMQSLPRKLGESIVRNALYAGAKVIADEARRLAPVRKGKGGGTLKRSLKPQTDRKGSDRNILVAKVSVTKPSEGRRNARAYAHLVEFGTAPHAVGKGSRLKSRGKQHANQHGLMHPGTKPQPFLRPAFDSKKFEALSVITEKIRADIAAAVAEGGKLPSRRVA